MGQRIVRVGELVQRELSSFLHSRWKNEAVTITFTGVDVSPDLKRADVYYSVVGGREERAKAAKFLLSIRPKLRRELGQKVILKYTPELYFSYDASVERGMHIIDLIDEIDEEQRENETEDAGEGTMPRSGDDGENPPTENE